MTSRIPAILLMVLGLVASVPQPKINVNANIRINIDQRPDASVIIFPVSTEPNVTGKLEIYEQSPSGVLITGFVTGLTPGLHGFHIHEHGLLTNECKDAGGHFNPFQKNHGSPNDTERHVGDLGNIYACEKGLAEVHIIDSHPSLDPSSEAYIGGRGFVVHAGEDDLGLGGNDGSLSTGNAGSRVGCGTIVVK